MDRVEPWEPTAEDEIRPGVREVDHMADLGIEVEGPTRDAIFERAAEGMFAIMWDEPDSVPTGTSTDSAPASSGEERRVSLRAEAVDTLFVRWLQELLYLYDAHRLIPIAVEFESLNDTHLVARVGLRRAEDTPARELKGVTYHELEVGPVGAQWRARVIFDV